MSILFDFFPKLGRGFLLLFPSTTAGGTDSRLITQSVFGEKAQDMMRWTNRRVGPLVHEGFSFLFSHFYSFSSANIQPIFKAHYNNNNKSMWGESDESVFNGDQMSFFIPFLHSQVSEFNPISQSNNRHLIWQTVSSD